MYQLCTKQTNSLLSAPFRQKDFCHPYWRLFHSVRHLGLLSAFRTDTQIHRNRFQRTGASIHRYTETGFSARAHRYTDTPKPVSAHGRADTPIHRNRFQRIRAPIHRYTETGFSARAHRYTDTPKHWHRFQHARPLIHTYIPKLGLDYLPLKLGT